MQANTGLHLLVLLRFSYFFIFTLTHEWIPLSSYITTEVRYQHSTPQILVIEKAKFFDLPSTPLISLIDQLGNLVFGGFWGLGLVFAWLGKSLCNLSGMVLCLHVWILARYHPNLFFFYGMWCVNVFLVANVGELGFWCMYLDQINSKFWWFSIKCSSLASVYPLMWTIAMVACWNISISPGAVWLCD